MEPRCLGNCFLKLRASPFLPFVMSSLSAPRPSFPADRSLESASFSLTKPRRSTSSTYQPVLQVRAAGTASSATPESGSNDPPQPYDGVAKHDQNVRRILDDIGIPRGPPKWPNPVSVSQERSPPMSSYDSLKNAFSRRSSPPIEQGSIHKKMNFPDNPNSGVVALEDIEHVTQSVIGRFRARATRTIESSPSIGRTIQVNPTRGVDLARALRNLNAECVKNSIRRDQFQQRFHERAGLKRKRLQRESRRRRFMEGFRAMVLKVLDMRRQGW